MSEVSELDLQGLLLRCLNREPEAAKDIEDMILSLRRERDALVKEKDQLVKSFSRRIEEMRKGLDIKDGDILWALREGRGDFYAGLGNGPSDEALQYMAGKVALLISERRRAPYA